MVLKGDWRLSGDYMLIGWTGPFPKGESEQLILVPPHHGNFDSNEIWQSHGLQCGGDVRVLRTQLPPRGLCTARTEIISAGHEGRHTGEEASRAALQVDASSIVVEDK